MIESSIYKKAIEDAASYLLESFDVSRLRGASILLAGASGMIGSVLVDVIMEMDAEAALGLRMTAMGRDRGRLDAACAPYGGLPNFRTAACDVNRPLPDLGRFDFIIHAASNTHPLQYSTDPVGTITANTIGTMNLLEYARLHGTGRFVFLSSVEVYGEALPGQEAFSETDMGYIDCNTLRAGYPEGKRCGEALCCAYARQYGLDCVVPRLCRVYGPTMSPGDSKALSQFIRKAAAGQDIVLKSDGSQFYSYVHAVDVASAVLTLLLKGESGEAYNVSSRKSDITLRTLAEKISSLAGTKVVFEIPDATERAGYSKATRAVLDNTKLHELGWKELYDIDSGLKLTLDILKGTHVEKA